MRRRDMSIDELMRSSKMSPVFQRPPGPDKPVLPRKAMYLHAGHMFSAAEAHDVTTILGSCVSVCLTDPVAGVGGVNHYMLPFDLGSGQGTPRFATFAIPHLVDDLVALGARRVRLEARVFGGACVLREFQKSGNDLGLRNIEAAHRLLADAAIPLVHEDVGGTQGRKIVYSTNDGSFVMKRL